MPPKTRNSNSSKASVMKSNNKSFSAKKRKGKKLSESEESDCFDIYLHRQSK